MLALIIDGLWETGESKMVGTMFYKTREGPKDNHIRNPNPTGPVELVLALWSGDGYGSLTWVPSVLAMTAVIVFPPIIIS